MAKKRKKNWIKSAIQKPGALRKSLGAKPGEPIAAGKLASAAGKPGKLGRRARLAVTLKKMGRAKSPGYSNPNKGAMERALKKRAKKKGK